MDQSMELFVDILMEFFVNLLMDLLMRIKIDLSEERAWRIRLIKTLSNNHERERERDGQEKQKPHIRRKPCLRLDTQQSN